MHNSDTLQRFIFENSNVRGVFVHLGNSYKTARQRYDYPAAIGQQLGQGLAASALLSATIKYEGSLIMQTQSNGAINLLVAQCSHDRHLRGLVRWQEENANFGKGHMTITIDKTAEERYQGITELAHNSLAQTIENYFLQSEQIQTHIWLAANEGQAVGMLLQHLPGKEVDPDLWDRIAQLGQTITEEELLTLPTEEILRRLFHEEDVRLFEGEPVSFRCSCSREKVATMLRSLGRDEARSIIAEEGKIEVGCEFCNQQYAFDAVDTEQLFASATPAPGGSDSTH